MQLKGANSVFLHSHNGYNAEVAGARGYEATLTADDTIAAVAGYVNCGGDIIASVQVDVYTCTEYQIATTATTTTTTISTTTETATSTTTTISATRTRTTTTTTTITTTSTTKTTTSISTTTATATPTTTETETLAVTTPTTTAAEAPLATSNASVGTGALPGAVDGTTSPSPDAARDPKKAVGVETTPPADGAGASAAANTTADPDGGGTSDPTSAIVGGVLGSLVLALLIFIIVREPAGGKTSIRQNVPTAVENQMYDYTHAALADGNSGTSLAYSLSALESADHEQAQASTYEEVGGPANAAQASHANGMKKQPQPQPQQPRAYANATYASPVQPMPEQDYETLNEAPSNDDASVIYDAAAASAAGSGGSAPTDSDFDSEDFEC